MHKQALDFFFLIYLSFCETFLISDPFPAFLHFFSKISHHFVLGFSGRGIYILYEDVKSCPYEDVHVLWSILVESHTSLPSNNEAQMHKVDRIWESSSYLHSPFLSSPSYVHKDIYDVFTRIQRFSFPFCFSGLLQFLPCHLKCTLVYGTFNIYINVLFGSKSERAFSFSCSCSCSIFLKLHDPK